MQPGKGTRFPCTPNDETWVQGGEASLAGFGTASRYVAVLPSRTTMSPVTLMLTPGAQHFVSNNGRLEVQVAAGTANATQVQSAGGVIHLHIVQLSS